MTTKLNCTVCGYTEIEDNNCPNCATDLSLLRLLQQLPQVILCPGEDLWLTQVTRGAEEDAEMRKGFDDQQLGHVLEAKKVISGYNSTIKEIKEYLFQDLVGAVFNRVAQGRIAVRLGVILFILTVSIGLGVVGCFLYCNPGGTSTPVVLINSPQNDGWKPSKPHWLLRTQYSATPVASTSAVCGASLSGEDGFSFPSQVRSVGKSLARRWLLFTTSLHTALAPQDF